MKKLILRSLETALIESFYFTKEIITQRAIYTLLDTLPEGNGKGVFLIPGLANNDHALHFIKKVLVLKGFHAETWGLGFNTGETPGMERKLYRKFLRLYDRHGESSVFGHSLGGHIAVALAHHYPRMIDRVITAGGAHNPVDIHPALPHLYKVLTGKTVTASWSKVLKEGNHTTDNVPVFHIVGTKDTILHPHHTHMHGNAKDRVFEVNTSHVGLIQSPVAVYTLIKLLGMKLGSATQ